MSEKYRNDQWVLDDHFGLAKTGDVVAKMALEVTPPFTIGVNGKWGSGKTSILRRAFATLGGQPISQATPFGGKKSEGNEEDWKKWVCTKRVGVDKLDWKEPLFKVSEQSLCVWFSPWQHQNEANPLIPLLLEIQNQFSVKHKFLHKGKEINRRGGLAALTLMERVIDAGSGLMGSPLKIKGSTEAVRKAWLSAEPELNKLSDGQRFHMLFEDAVETILESLKKNNHQIEKKRLIIFIDDLDRCEEHVVVTLLEAIKLYLDTKRCVFVLGMDDSAILGALKRHWERSDDDNREYLEKLLQATVHVPLPNQKDVETEVISQLKAHGFQAPDFCAMELVQLLEPNPRKIKNFLNSLCANWNLLSLPESQNEIHFIMFHYLRLFHRAIWRILERQPNKLDVLRSVLNKELGESSSEEERMLRLFFQRSFSHVLDDDDKENEKHLSQDLEKAVDLFQQRQDRKRSDEYFVFWFTDNIKQGDVVPDHYLHIAQEPSTQGDNNEESIS